MKRELKFRVWDKFAKTYIYPDQGYQGHYILTLDGRFQNLQNGSGGDEYIVQQYTCMKDANSKDVYEGDIVELVRMNTTHKCEIKYKLGAFIAEYINPASTMSFHWLHSINAEEYPLKVIGNIYEKSKVINVGERGSGVSNAHGLETPL